jgi:hypothetical protein
LLLPPRAASVAQAHCRKVEGDRSHLMIAAVTL